LLLPQGADQPANAAACVAAGVAEALAPERVSADAVADAATRLVADHDVAGRAAAIRDELAAMPGPDEVLRGLTADVDAAA
jgi:UDP:flavonoid glycosyltransferase YjiC (YdhE family)